MFIVTRAPQIVVFDHEQRVPMKDVAHERDEPRRHIRVDVDPWILGQPLCVGT
jgi:hypothetical protein